MSAVSHHFPHTRKRSHRRQWAGLLIFVYMMIVLSPLAPFAMHSKSIAHAVTGECSGDCDIDGCSLENRMHHSCCCVQKKQRAAKVTPSTDVCCVPKVILPVVEKGNSSESSRAVAVEDDWILVKGTCCAKSNEHQHEVNVPSTQSSGISSSGETYYKCGSPCGKSKLFAIASAGAFELIPVIYSEQIVIPHETTQYAPLTYRMTSRYADPPEQPPRLSVAART
ncbi:MAG: hypothetical protein PHI31_03435 [Desulfuromonadaceae bacterium]|nr:hypothetical protein [Desulfuromonadaceae bacterium]